MFKDLKRVTYQVSDMDAARNWYSNLLGLKPVYDSPVSVAFMIGGILLMLVRERDPLMDDSGRVTVYWEVENVDAAFRRMIDLGASPHAEPMNYPAKRIARVRDPFGNIVGLAGSIPDERGKDLRTHPSDTAMYVAFFRALAAQDDRPEIKGPDTYAHLFLSEESKKPLMDPCSRKSPMFQLWGPLYAYFVARTAFFDHVFEEALHDRMPQIVNLGSGYDTRAYRFRDSLQQTRVFELDALATQNRKRDILQKESILPPTQLSFVPIDFKIDDLSQTLEKAGFDRKRRSLFLWEGVMYYLSVAEVDRVMDAIKNNSMRGSRLCFDYVTEKLPSSSANEAIQFGIEEEQIPSFLAARGYKVLDHVNTGEMARRYLTLGDGTLGEKPVERMHFVLAERSEEK